MLVAHLLKWRFQPPRRSHSWRNTIREQRAAIEADLKACPSLKPLLHDADWLEGLYRRAKIETYVQISLQELPAAMPWTIEQVMSREYLPDQ